jgi:cytochrome b561
MSHGTAMSAGDQRPAFGRIMRAMHWGTAALLLGAYPAAWMIGSIASGAETAWLVMLHRSFGVSILVLTGLRLVFRQYYGIPPLPADVPMTLRRAARASDALFYLLLILQPLLGLAGSMLFGDRIVLFGGTVLPILLPVNHALGRQIFQVHGVTAVLLLALIGLHVAAALYHHFVRKDGVLAGMLPGVQYLPPSVDLGPGGLPDGGHRQP